MDLTKIRIDNKTKLYAHLYHAKSFVEKRTGHSLETLQLAMGKVQIKTGITTEEYRNTLDWMLDVVRASGALDQEAVGHG